MRRSSDPVIVPLTTGWDIQYWPCAPEQITCNSSVMIFWSGPGCKGTVSGWQEQKSQYLSLSCKRTYWIGTARELHTDHHCFTRLLVFYNVSAFGLAPVFMTHSWQKLQLAGNPPALPFVKKNVLKRCILNLLPVHHFQPPAPYKSIHGHERFWHVFSQPETLIPFVGFLCNRLSQSDICIWSGRKKCVQIQTWNVSCAYVFSPSVSTILCVNTFCCKFNSNSFVGCGSVCFGC